MIQQPCLTCGEPTQGARCDLHKPKHPPKKPTVERGYDSQWQKLSKRARELQPWCTVCGSTRDLQADHLPIAWERKAKGLAVRLQDVDVKCGPCNIKAGSARAGHKRND